MKTASLKEEFERNRRNESFKSYMESVRESEPKSFSKGFLAGAALPSLLALAGSDLLHPRVKERIHKSKERQHYSSIAFQSAGVDKAQSKELAMGLDRVFMTSGIKGAEGRPLDKSLKSATQGLIQQQPLGQVPLTDTVGDASVTIRVDWGVSKPMPVKIYMDNFLPNLKGEGLKASVEDASEQIMKTKFPEITKGKSSLISSKEYSDIINLGKHIAKDKKAVYSRGKTNLKQLASFMRGNLKFPAIFGIAGGIGAVLSTKKRKKEFETLRRLSNVKR